ncbi:hypothetical protein EU513_14500 [Yimella sp. RIT 621]|uniref:hypothetical protein n=1 Tax=Yimella sp. RIT 621 TaxID=2510323 RepID=UPI00101BCD97|nr:hypothetical protein [Yimella sp. RIT 621]RYG76040.1 hypothetical protein EU513_14500 [Yimella sp. RIT 621]
MARIDFRPDATVEQVMRTVRETFQSRDYLWEQTDAENAVASEGGKPVRTAALPVSQRVRVSITINAKKHKLTLTLESIGAAYSAAGGGWFYIQLASSYRKMVKAVREDLAAAALR